MVRPYIISAIDRWSPRVFLRRSKSQISHRRLCEWDPKVFWDFCSIWSCMAGNWSAGGLYCLPNIPRGSSSYLEYLRRADSEICCIKERMSSHGKWITEDNGSRWFSTTIFEKWTSSDFYDRSFGPRHRVKTLHGPSCSKFELGLPLAPIAGYPERLPDNMWN